MLVDQGNLARARAVYASAVEIAVPFAEAGPKNAEWQRDLSASYDRIGDVLRVQGNLQAALDWSSIALSDCYAANR